MAGGIRSALRTGPSVAFAARRSDSLAIRQAFARELTRRGRYRKLDGIKVPITIFLRLRPPAYSTISIAKSLRRPESPTFLRLSPLSLSLSPRYRLSFLTSTTRLTNSSISIEIRTHLYAPTEGPSIGIILRTRNVSRVRPSSHPRCNRDY